MSEKVEYVEVVVKVPKRLMELLEKKQFFGWGRERFFTVAVKTCVSAEVNELDFEEVEKLERQYGDEIGGWGIRLDKIPEDLKKRLAL